jgi:hypothetical protein
VRQYYTLLNQAPAHLHRFYNNNSSFVHGGLDAPNRETKPVVGQKQIHQKIQQLNFRDCHAKISQVDSQATLGDGVVVQVTGELSNSGQPMRRFTQTFVLAAQSPKKYYVHNDIFRYQDMIFSDEEVEQDSGRSEAEEDAEPEHSPSTDAIPTQQLVPQQTMAYYNNANTAINNAAAGAVPPQQHPQPQPQQQQQPPQLTTATLTPHQQIAAPPTVLPAPHVTAAVVNGTAHPEEVISAAIPVAVMPSSVAPTPSMPQQAALIPAQTPIQSLQPIPQAQMPLQQAAAPSVVPPPGHHIIKHEAEEVEQDNAVEDDNEEEQEGTDDHEAVDEEGETTVKQETEDTHHLSESVSNEPKTYATLVKSGGTGVGMGSLVSAVSNPNVPAKPTTSPPPVVSRASTDSRDSMQASGMSGGVSGAMLSGQRNARGGARGPSVRGMVRNDRGGPTRGSFNEDTGSTGGDGDRRRMGPNMMQQYPDNQQLFMGNLPHHATEEDLKELFGKFGTIVDLRIHSKPNNKGVQGNRVPNYGFIIFDDANVVQQVLNSRPFFFPSDGGQKLNVEEKKTRARSSLDGGRSGSGGDPVSGRPSSGGFGGPRGITGGITRGGPVMGHHRGGGRGGTFSREGRGGGMNRGGYARR